MSERMSAEIILPWPDKRLSPNARMHWAKLADAKKRAKKDAHNLTLAAGIRKIAADALTARVSFYPPDRRPRDIDNALASCKAYFDGIALAIGVDDSKWQIELAPKGPVDKDGKVKVELEWTT